MVRGDRLKNLQLKNELIKQGGKIEDWGKHTTKPQIPHPETGKNFEVHFYRNKITNDVYYGMDYKMVFQDRTQINIEIDQPDENFDSSFDSEIFNP